jgi:hypothetical protein
MIDLTIHPDRLERTVKRARERNIIIPTFRQMRNPALVPDKIKARLKNVGLWDVNPLNLFRITWHNEPVATGGGFGGVNYLELPKALTGVDARIFVLVGKWFPTGTRWVQRSAAWCRGWSRVSSTRPPRRLSGPPPATTAGAAPTIRRCWAASRLPSCRRA